MTIQWPVGHRSIRTVVWQFSNDAIAGTAIRTIDVRVVKAAIRGIEKFRQTSLTHSQIRRDSNGGLPFSGTFANCELLGAGQVRRFDVNFRDRSGVRRSLLQLIEEKLEEFLFSLKMNHYSIFCVQHPAL